MAHFFGSLLWFSVTIGMLIIVWQVAGLVMLVGLTGFGLYNDVTS